MVEQDGKMKAFPCDHAICEDCVSKLTRWCTSCDRAHCIKCPMCNDMVYCVTQLSDDHRNDKFLDVIKAVSSRGIGKTRQLIYSFKRLSAIDIVCIVKFIILISIAGVFQDYASAVPRHRAST